ncbi:hypothetical protein Vadar_031382 [Vaccinium darrowii]|uniref:Uncharacterized protein n=1 Tax=Vaccinium darrowii TaxID=229202 RepID=A0ACB7YHA1_9ERIC|nr:hypothetical protein Vadar_031382 [Vaccinium darrowii]
MATSTDWTLVSRKRVSVEKKFRYHSSLRTNCVSVYVDNLPFEMDEVWLRQIFRGYGDVVDVFIPNKRSLRFNTKFGFVRFKSRAMALCAVQDLHGLLIRDFRIQVKLARFAHCSDSTNFKRMPCDSNVSQGNPVASDFQDFNIKHSRFADANNPSFADIVTGAPLRQSESLFLQKIWKVFSI